MNTISKDQANQIFPDESYTKAIELIEKFKRLIPHNKDKVTYLDTLITYVDGLINGDQIHQFITYQHLSEYAKEALKEIMDETHEQILESYRIERMNLQDAVSSLSIQKDNLDKEVQSLQQSRSLLVMKTASLRIELEKIAQELNDLRANGLSNIHKEIDGERQRRIDEINALEEQKKNLTTAITELKNLINEYNKKIMALKENDGELTVTWEPIEENSPIYSLNKSTIENYIISLEQTYMQKTGTNEKDAKQIIRFHCQGLFSIWAILENHIFGNEIDENNTTIKTIITKSKWEDKDDLYIAVSLREALETIKLPVYKAKRKNIDTESLNPDTIPANMSTILRELYLQRVATEAIAKQKILETELRVLVDILKQVAPPNFDFTPYTQLNTMLEPNDNPNRGL